MFPDDEESPAQDPNAPDVQSDDAGEETNEVARKIQEGTQKRIDELTAKQHEYERQLAAANERAAALTTQLLTRSNEPKEDPYKDLDPTLRKFMEDQIGAVHASSQKTIAAMAARFEAQTLAQEARAIAAQAGGDETIQREAAEAVAGLRKQGIQANGQDAADWALGKALREGRLKLNGNTAQPNGRKPVSTFSGNRGPDLSTSAAQKPLPENFDELDPDEQIKILEKRGVNNRPLGS